ncbi:MAG: protein kinase [Deltaproteobacteria bacterium]|nr:protein kinase [Deltaproteobacteria bacterium]
MSAADPNASTVPTGLEDTGVGSPSSTLPPGLTATDSGRGLAHSTAPGLVPGTMLAHFRVEAPIGRGGMGEVYRATDVALDRPVAIKVLPADVGDDPRRRERMIREARAQARIVHGNVCHIYYVGEERGLLFFAMELVPGETLAERLARGALPPGEAIELVRTAALGLRAAHAQGYTHRDVKPSNLMVDGGGQLKIVDFGLVTRGTGAATGDMSMTTAVGTPLYMAPEQARGDEVDFRADIYALGATLHHLVSGRPPFAGDDPDSLRSQHATALRPVLAARGRRGRVLELVDGVCARMMAKRPEDRFDSYDALIAELERISPVRTPPAGVWVRMMAAGLDLVACLFLTALVANVLPTVEENAILWGTVLVFMPLAIARWGRTLGRALLEIEVVSVTTGRPPTWRRAMLRTLAEYGVPALMTVFANDNERHGQGVEITVGIALGLTTLGPIVALAYASWLRPDKRTFWDRAAGTMVRYRRPPPT